MPTYISVEDEPEVVRIQLSLGGSEKFRIYQHEGYLYVKILKKATVDLKPNAEEAFGVLFVVKDSYDFNLTALEELHDLQLQKESVSTVTDCGKGLLEIQIPYIQVIKGT
jgi:hypothetical protein